MSLTVLFDLDDTLLNTNIQEFMPEYYKALTEIFSHVASEEKMVQQIRFAVQQMIANDDPEQMLMQIFDKNFYQPLGTSEADCAEAVNVFYKNEFPKLRYLTQPKPEAPDLIDWCISNNMALAIATNPLFPREATRQRIMWAGLKPEDFTLYSTYHDFHFTKPNLAYYAEVMGRLGWPELPTAMIGDDLKRDILPVEIMGYETFWINPITDESDQTHGQLAEVQPWLKQLMKNGRYAVSETPEVLTAILRSTPAVFDTWLKTFTKETLLQKPSKQEWCFVEVLCHIADFEKEIFLPQWEQLNANPLETITPANTRNWAKTRKYQCHDPEEAFKKFVNARRESLDIIEALWKNGLFERAVNHTVFNKTKVAELVAFSAKHDRLHLQQAKNLLNFYEVY